MTEFHQDIYIVGYPVIGASGNSDQVILAGNYVIPTLLL